MFFDHENIAHENLTLTAIRVIFKSFSVQKMHVVGKERSFSYWNAAQKQCPKCGKAEKTLSRDKGDSPVIECVSDNQPGRRRGKKLTANLNQNEEDKDRTTKTGVSRVFGRIAAICLLCCRKRKRSKRRRKLKRSYVWQRSVTDTSSDDRKLSIRWKIELPSTEIHCACEKMD